MLDEAFRYLRGLLRDLTRRSDAFEALAKLIEAHSGSTWRATRGTGTDGSVIFLGRQGEGLVVSSDGRIFRGSLFRGIDITPNGLRPDFGSLRPLD